jgi:hypothetical protein
MGMGQNPVALVNIKNIYIASLNGCSAQILWHFFDCGPCFFEPMSSAQNPKSRPFLG